MKKILFIVSEDWYFVSHRLHLATTAINDGHEVLLLSRMSEHQGLINSLGIETIDWTLKRSSRNLLLEFKTIYCIYDVIRNFKPDLVHAVAMKPVFYTALSSIFADVNGRIFAFGGLGFIFRSHRIVARMLRLFFVPIFRLLLRGKNIRLIIQNKDDRKLMENYGIIGTKKIRLIRGAGVDTMKFFPQYTPHRDTLLVILPARMLWDKGVEDFVICAQRCKKKKVNARFVLIGDRDPHNPECIPDSQLKKWIRQGAIEWWGRQDDILSAYHKADIVCFPSYHEGLPKTLLEAASCGLPIVSYDVPGCREVVQDTINGFLIPLKDRDALLLAVLKLLEDSKLRYEMGQRGRKLILKDFTQEKIAAETISVWNEFLK